MPVPAITFREIHRLRRWQQLREQIDRVPRQRKIQQARVAGQEEIRREAQEAIKHLKVEIHGKEVTLKTAHGQIAKYQKQLNEAESKKEYDALQHELNDAKSRVPAGGGRNPDQASPRAKRRRPSCRNWSKAVKEAKDEYAKFEAGVQERLAGLQGATSMKPQTIAYTSTRRPSRRIRATTSEWSPAWATTRWRR